MDGGERDEDGEMEALDLDEHTRAPLVRGSSISFENRKYRVCRHQGRAVFVTKILYASGK